MSNLNRPGKRPSPDDLGSEWSEISEDQAQTSSEGRLVKRQRTRSSRAEADHEPARFLPGLWLVERTWGLTKSLLGLGGAGKS